MKANEFVRKFGISTAKDVLNNVDVSKAACFAMMSEPCIDYTELKRLVESHELVENVGGLDDAQHRLLHLALIDSHKEMKVLASAIADVESCL